MPAESFPNICGPSYETLSPAEGVERSLNLYFEASEAPYKPKGPAALYQRAGSTAFGSIPPTVTGAVRGMIQFDGNGVPDGAIFGVSGSTFWQMNPDGTQISHGSVADDGLPAYIAANAASVGQIFVASAGHGYCLDTNTGVFAEIPNDGVNFFGARDVTFIDGYFVVLSDTTNGQQFQISALNDGTTWAGADVAVLLGQTDPLQRCIANIEYLYFIGTRRGQIWYNSGNALFPFTIESGAFLEWGTAAPGSVCKATKNQSTTIYWLGQNAQGANVALSASGQQTERISDHAVEAAWSNKDPNKFNGQVYPTTEDCICYPFVWNGHSMVRFIFPSANTGWDYDVTESASAGFRVWNPVAFTDANGVLKAPFERAHAYAFEKHLIGSGGADGVPGGIYEMDEAACTDAAGSTFGQLVPTGVTGTFTFPATAADTTLASVNLSAIITAPFCIREDATDELMVVTSAVFVLGFFTLTVVRGQGGTTAQPITSLDTLTVLDAVGFPLTRDRIVRLPFNNGLRVILDRLEIFGQPGTGVSAVNTEFPATATKGSDTFLAADTSGLTVGQTVTGDPVQSGSTLLAIVDNVSIQLSTTALATGDYVLTGLSTIPGANPVLLVKISRDGGRTWGSEIEVPMGQQGQTTMRWIINRLGYYRDGALWIRVTDPVFVAFVGAALGIRRLAS